LVDRYGTGGVGQVGSRAKRSGECESCGGVKATGAI
jgi:hypothetical protein